MATKNLKKIVRKIYMNAKEKDPTKRTFSPLKYPKNWGKAIKHLEARDKRLTFNKIFKPLFAQIYHEDVKAYLAGGHKLSHIMQKGLKENAKKKAREITQAQIAIKAAAQQGGIGQEEVQP